MGIQKTILVSEKIIDNGNYKIVKEWYLNILDEPSYIISIYKKDFVSMVDGRIFWKKVKRYIICSMCFASFHSGNDYIVAKTF